MSRLLIATILLVVSYSNMFLTQPISSSFPNKSIQYWYANFGKVSYGKSMSFKLIYMESLCSNVGLDHLNISAYILTGNMKECPETQNARIAQSLGAKGILIGRNNLPNDKIINADDGNGRKVHITTLFITMESLNNLKNLQNPQIQVNFQVVKKDRTDVTLFLSASGRQNYIFLRNFVQYYHRIKNRINLQLIYDTFQCRSCDPSECILNQKYCALGKQRSQKGSGSLIVKEQIQQYTIFQKMGSDKWFEYMILFDEYCDGDWLQAQECSEKIIKKLQIKKSLVDIEDVMMQWRYKKTTIGFIADPQISVNSVIFSGGLNAEDLFVMICDSLDDAGSQCSEEIISDGNYLIVIVIIILVVILGIIPAMIWFYQKLIKKELTSDLTLQVDQQVAIYARKVDEINKKRKRKIKQRLNEQL